MTREKIRKLGYEFKENVVGKLKWADGRDGEAVVKDSQGNEYYVESSSSPLFDFKNNQTKVVTFDIVNVPGYGLMAFNCKQYF